MDMGSGEVELTSSRAIQLNDLLDHHVSLVLTENQLRMTINNIYTTFIDLQTEDEDLNIDIGVFLGGVGDLEVDYLNTAISYLRGCMSNVKIESHQFDILSSVAAVCHDTREECSSEFEAGEGEVISFLSSDSFISFPTWTRTNADSRYIEMLMKTTIEDSLLLFHPGHQTDFIGLGMTRGHLKGVVDQGSGMMVLNNAKVKLDDDQWHRIKMQINPKSIEITVDSESVSLTLNGSDKLDLVGNLYIGGIQGKMKEVFQDDFLTHMEREFSSESFVGCLGEIKVNQKDRTLLDALITKDIKFKCDGDDYDYSTYYDFETTSTPPVHITYVTPDERHCVPTDDMPEIFRNVSKLLDITPLLVPESGEAFIDVKNLNPTFNLNAAEIRQSQIIFTLMSDPWYGLVDMNINPRRTRKFTLLDVMNKKIKYLHDNNEKYNDEIQLDVVAYGPNLPVCFKTAHRYVLPVEIVPVNDIPQLSSGNISVTANGRTQLSPNLIKIVDSDNRCDKLIVTVTSDPEPNSYLENIKHPGWSLQEFTCRQLKDGLIYYVHEGGSVSALTLNVSDGDLISQSTTLRLAITQPQMSLVTNTGLVLTQGSNSAISIQNLWVSATPRNGDIIFTVTQPLKFGELQIIGDDDELVKVSIFHQYDLEQNRLRYVTTIADNLEDTHTEYIHFNAQLGQYTLMDNTFNIIIVPSQVRMLNIVPIEILNREPTVIKQTELKAVVDGQNINSNEIKYIIWKSPALGSLMLRGMALSDGDTVTQQDIDIGLVTYKPTVYRATDATDSFQFKVFAYDQYSKLYTYPITIKADSSIHVLTNERLVVLDGNESILNKEYLWVQTPQSTNFVYRITEDPKHGHLIRDSPPGVPRFEGAIRVFSNEDIQLNRLIYKHDGSDTSNDQFTFLVFNEQKDNPILPNEGQEVIKATFNIAIQSRNDHEPQRVIDKPFNVVRNGQRLLTTADILFRNDDADFNDTQLVYNRVGILSGSIVSSADPSQPIYRFTQADLRDGKVLFVHRGADRERFQLQVSDGLHKTTALLQVQASKPYLNVINNSMIVIDHGTTKTFDTSILYTESNIDIRSDENILYKLKTPPSEGRIIVSGINATQFTQEDIKKGVVSYEHDEQSLRSKDFFVFTVQANGFSTEGTFRIELYKTTNLSEPQVAVNKVIIAYIREYTVINQNYLKVR